MVSDVEDMADEPLAISKKPEINGLMAMASVGLIEVVVRDKNEKRWQASKSEMKTEKIVIKPPISN